MKTTDTTRLADTLFEAHVRFSVEALTGESLATIIEELLDTSLEQAEKLTLAGAVSAESIKATARAYATQVELKGSIPELSAEVTRALRAHPIHERTRLEDLVSDRQVEHVLRRGLELSALRGRLLHAILASPVYETFASDLLYRGIRGYLARMSHRSRRHFGGALASRIGAELSRRTSPKLRASVEARLEHYVQSSVRAISLESATSLIDGAHDGLLLELLMDSWKRAKGTRLAAIRSDVSDEDVEDLFVTGYELWLELRRAEIIGVMIDASIDALYEKYGDTPLSELLEELGITRALMLAEGMRFGPPVVAAMHAEGLIEPLVRLGLEPFYRSDAFAAALATERESA